MPNRFKVDNAARIHPVIVWPLAEILFTQPYNASSRGNLKNEKNAIGMGIYGSGPRQELVSLTCILCKCSEKVNRRQIYGQLVNHSAISAARHQL